MQLTLKPTGQIEDVRGTPCWVWAGETSDAMPVKAWVAMVELQTTDPERLSACEAALTAVPYERRLVSIDHRMVT